MNRKNQNAPGTNGKTRFSIVYKLNFRIMLRLIWIFIFMDVIICIFAAASTLIYIERTAANAAELLISSGMPEGREQAWLNSSGIFIAIVEEEPEGFVLPMQFNWMFPESTAGAERDFEFTGTGDRPVHIEIEDLKYVIYLRDSDTYYKITFNLGFFIKTYKIIFTALIIIQLFMFLSRVFGDARLIRRTLDPIAEFTRVAQRLNTESGRFDPEKMAALAGKLEGINASRLDTRIQIDETQGELKNLARAINGMLDRINASYRAQVRFVSDASHELRTPISVIQGYANLLDRWGKHDEKTLQESITAIKDEAANMKDLIEQLLFLARGDNNTMMLQFEQLDLAEPATDVVNEMRMINSTHEFEAKLSETVTMADKALIKQALRILVDNAIKYSDPGGHITVKTDREDEYVKLVVQDDGMGIRSEEIPHIFDRFYRADESRARATGGTGLGLSIAKWIASRHGGHMEVLSREGLGTRITIVLPATSVVTSVKPDDPKND